MQTKNKILNFLVLLKTNFFLPFYITSWLVFLAIYVLNFNIFANQKNVNLQILIAGFFMVFLFWLKQIKSNSDLKKFITNISKEAFIISLLLTTLINLRIINIINPANSFYLIIASMVSCFIFLYLDKSKSKSSIEEQLEVESISEKNDVNNFAKCFSTITRTPIIGSFFKFINKQGFIYLILLSLILLSFTLIKTPFFNYSFTGENEMKYNTYVEPAKYMAERNNPFWFQQKYLADIFERPEGNWATFGRIPLTEWGLFLTFKALPSNTIEMNTRLFTNALGILILILSYIFFKKWLPKIYSLFIVFLISINPIVNLSSFVTVEDSWLIIFTLLTLIYLSKYLKNKEASSLFYSGLFLGIGACNKYSIFLWLIPIISILLIFNKKNISFTRDVAVFIILALIPTFAFRSSLRYLPTNATLSILAFIIWVAVFYGLFYYIVKKEHLFQNLIIRITRHKYLLASVTVLVIVSLTVFALMTKIFSFTNEFLTDSSLIFNWVFYQNMLNQQFKVFLTAPVYFSGLFAILVSLLLAPKKLKILLFSFFASSFFYWIVASKVIFFHAYYTNIIMITFCLSLGIMLYLISKSFSNKVLLFVIIFCFVILIIPPSLAENINHLKKQKDINSLNQVAEYLLKNTSENEIYLDESYLLNLTIATGRPRIEADGLYANEALKKSIHENGFSKTLTRYHVKYLITKKEHPTYENFANLFTDDPIESVSYRRSDLILNKLDINHSYFSDQEKRDKIILENSIEEKFILEKEFGEFKIYSFSN